MTKNLKYFFIFLFLLGCGYTPIYQVKKSSNIKIIVDIGMGKKNFTVYTMDLTKEYIDINANYRS